jgi:hypothetical protein
MEFEIYGKKRKECGASEKKGNSQRQGEGTG